MMSWAGLKTCRQSDWLLLLLLLVAAYVCLLSHLQQPEEQRGRPWKRAESRAEHINGVHAPECHQAFAPVL